MIPLWIIGSGGHASEVIENAESGGRYKPVGILDDARDHWGTMVHGLPVHGPITREVCDELRVAHAVIAIGSNRARADIVDRLGSVLVWVTLIHPSAYVSARARIAHGVVIGVHAVVQPGSSIGEHAILNTKAVVGHDVSVGSFSHIGPGVILAGSAGIGAGAFLGTSVSVIPGMSVGDWATIGAGAVVVAPIPARATAVGIPAHVKKMPSEGQ